jgi:hypothetical protein
MKTLWIFGDSFSSDYDYNHLHENHIKYMEIKNINTIPTWSTILGDKLMCNVKNLAKGENSNYDIFQNFCDNCSLIDNEDIVIIGWSLISKFRISLNNQFVSIGPDSNRDYGSVSKDTIKEIIDNRTMLYENKRDRWAEEIYFWENAIRTLSKHKNFKVYFWTSEEPRLIYSENKEFKENKNYLCSESEEMLLSYLNKLGCTSMSDETNGIVGDSHYGIDGHEKQADIFFNDIING